MPRVVFEPTTTVFEQAKIIHTLDRSATVIGACENNKPNDMGIMARKYCGKSAESQNCEASRDNRC
jgi:hypothetical protein